MSHLGSRVKDLDLNVYIQPSLVEPSLWMLSIAFVQSLIGFSIVSRLRPVMVAVGSLLELGWC